ILCYVYAFSRKNSLISRFILHYFPNKICSNTGAIQCKSINLQVDTPDKFNIFLTNKYLYTFTQCCE
ncbi:MAG: hypothetical protein SAK29_15300, partial [Scytonema sp. PMC 1069.18]|nr:hypothetical protein [Scytonema sp. PMC 1069.18]